MSSSYTVNNLQIIHPLMEFTILISTFEAHLVVVDLPVQALIVLLALVYCSL